MSLRRRDGGPRESRNSREHATQPRPPLSSEPCCVYLLRLFAGTRGEPARGSAQVGSHERTNADEEPAVPLGGENGLSEGAVHGN